MQESRSIDRAEGVNLSGVKYDEDCKWIALWRIPLSNRRLGAEGVSLSEVTISEVRISQAKGQSILI